MGIFGAIPKIPDKRLLRLALRNKHSIIPTLGLDHPGPPPPPKPPPKPAAPIGGGGGDTSGLFGAINAGGFKLKKTVTVDKSAPLSGGHRLLVPPHGPAGGSVRVVCGMRA